MAEQHHRREDDPPGGLLPRPDPTVLTTSQLLREIAGVREYIDSNVHVLEQRFADIDRATQLRREAFENQVKSLNDVVEERFRTLDQRFDVIAERFTSVAKQFDERDIRGQQQAEASGAALAAALQAAKELVGAQGEASAAAAVKSETSFTKQIDQIGTIIQTLEKALDARITELKERIDRGEGTTQGAVDQRAAHVTERQQSNASINVAVAVLGAVVGVILVALALYAAVHG
jgi:hypothetical protein